MKRFQTLLLLLVGLMFSYSAATSQVITQPLTNSPGQYNYDANTLTEANWTTFARTEVGTVTSVSVTFTWQTDFFPDEGSLRIRHPDMTVFNLINLGVTSSGVTIAANSTTTYTLPVTAFNNKTVAGTWAVFILDDYGDGGHAVTNATVTINYTVPPMVYTSSTTLGITNAVAPGTTNAPIIAVQVVTSGVASPLNATSFTFSTGTTLPANISNARVYYTGTSGTFATTTQFGTVVAAPNGVFTVTGTQALATGNNFFWLTFDVAGTAPNGALINATCNSLIVDAISRTPTVTAPTTAREVVSPFSGTYNVGTGNTYTTLGAILNHISAVGMTGNVNIFLTSNTTETVQATLATPPTGANFTLTIKPAAGVNPNVTINHTGQALFTNGFNNLIIDGSNTVGGTTKNLTFTHTNTTSATAHGLFIQNANNVTVKNVNIMNGTAALGNAAIVFAAVTNGTIENNTITRAGNGIVVQNACNNITIIKNTIGSTTPANTVSNIGMNFTAGTGFAHAVTGLTVEDNEIAGMVYSGGAASAFHFGLSVGIVHNGTFRRNVVRNMTNSLGHNIGIFVNGAAGTNNLNLLFANNVIRDFVGDAANGNMFGTYLLNANNVNFYHNTYFFGTTTTGFYVLGNRIAGGCSNLRFNNNIMHVDPGTTAKIVHYCDDAQSVNPFVTLNNNIYNLTAGFSFGRFAPGFHATLGAWTTALGNGANNSDQQSKMKIPAFAGVGAPWLAGAAVGDADYIVPLLPTVTTDFDNETRTAELNYAGADIAVPTFAVTTNLDASRIVCVGGTTSYLAIAEHTGWADGVSRTATGAWTYEWYKNGSPLVPDQYMTVTGQTLIFNNARTEHTGNYQLKMMRFNGHIMSGNAYLDVQSPITVSNLNPIGACIGAADVILSVSTTGTVTSYQWQKEAAAGVFNNIAGATGASFAIPLADPVAATGNYRVKVFGPGNCGPVEVVSNVAPVILTQSLSAATVTSVGDPANICEESDIMLTANATGTITGFQWQKIINGVWVNINALDNPTAAQATLVLPFAKPENSGSYRAVIYGSPQCPVNVLNTPQIDITVWPLFKFDYQPQSQVLCEGNQINLNVIGVGDISGYQWYVDGKPIDAAKNPTAATAFLEIKNANYLMSGSYSCMLLVTDCMGVNRPEFSAPAEVYIMSKTVITKQPRNTAVKLGNVARFQVEAHHKGLTPPFYRDKFQWYRFNALSNTSTMIVDNERISGAQSSMLSIRDVQPTDFAHSGDYYYVVIDGQCGSVTSAKAELTESMEETLTILTHPVDATVCELGSVVFEVEAESSAHANLKYQWYLDGGKLDNDANISGATTAKLTIANATLYHVGEYTVKITWTEEALEVTSDGAMLDVDPLPVILTQPETPQNLTVGKDLELEVLASDALYYQWYKDGVELTGETFNTLTILSVDAPDAGVYSVEVSNDCGAVMSIDVDVTVTKAGTTGLRDEARGIKLHNVSPNPASDMAVVRFEMTEIAPVRISLIDETGREVAVIFNGDANIGENRVEISSVANNLISGSYFVVLNSRGERLVTKFVVVK